MPTSAMIFLGVVLLLFAALDVAMLFTLMRPGDERNQAVVWRAGSFTLQTAVGALLLDAIDLLVRGDEARLNPIILLELIAICYFGALLHYKRKLGG